MLIGYAYFTIRIIVKDTLELISINVGCPSLEKSFLKQGLDPII